jgi:aminopeptidase
MESIEAPSAAALERYAELIVKDGVNVQPGQEVFVQAPVEASDFAFVVAQAAYRAGAGHVTLSWYDDRFTRLEYENCPREYFENTPAWKIAQMNDLSAAGAANVLLYGQDPDALDGVDQAKVVTASRARNTQCDVWRHNLDFGINPWTIAGVATTKWAEKVFPDKRGVYAKNALWNAILSVSRVTDEPLAAWDAHDALLKANRDKLNALKLASLHYESSNGTDLVVGLNPEGIWEGGSSTTVGGVRYFPNIPTEEIFTSPDRTKTEGFVHSALPLVVGGRVVKDFWFKFERGKVVDFGALEGKDALEQLLDTDEGSRYLGECALISKDTPIRQSGVLFYNTLYDENASCHLALGMGFPECVTGGLEATEDELAGMNVNRSAAHEDFMIGADDLRITGTTRDGREVPVFEDGRWAW